MKWTACYITLNGADYIWYSIKSIYNFIKASGGKIIVIEGSTKYATRVAEDGNSVDDTKDIIDGFVKDDKDGVIIYKRLGKVDSKCDLRNAYFDVIRELPEKEQPDWLLVCFMGNTQIETKSGVKQIRNIKEGEYVKTHNGEYKQVIRKIKRHYTSYYPLIKINNRVKCTPEHPFYVYSDGKYQWKHSSELMLDDMLTYPAHSDIDNDILNFDVFARGYDAKGGNNGKLNGTYFGEIEVNRDLARFFGLYLAEGSLSNDGIRFTFNNNEKEYIEFVKRTCRKVFKREPTVYSRWATTVKLNIRSLSKRFEQWFGDNAKTKRIPDFVKDWNLDNRLSFIRGYIEGDGSSDTNRTITIGTSSIQLLNDLYELSVRSGLKVSKYPPVGPKVSVLNRLNESNQKLREVTSSTSYRMGFSKKAYNHIMDICNAKKHDNYYLIPITNIENKKMPQLEDQSVYNLEVDDDNSYIADGFSVHNCDDDELYKQDDLKRLDYHLSTDNNLVYIFNPQYWFWGDFNHICATDEDKVREEIKAGNRKDKLFYDVLDTEIRQGEFHERIFKWNPGLHYQNHATITDGDNKDVYIHPDYKNRRIIYPSCPRYHYGYLKSKENMMQRFTYYSSRDNKIDLNNTKRIMGNVNVNPYVLYLRGDDIVDNKTKETGYQKFERMYPSYNVEKFTGDHPYIITKQPCFPNNECKGHDFIAEING